MQKRAPNAAVPVVALTIAIYMMVNLLVDIHGLWWVVAFTAFPGVMYVSAFLIAMFAPGLFFPEGEPKEEPPKSAALGHMLILECGPAIGTYRGEPIHDYVIAKCSDGATRKFTFKSTVSEEPDDPPADRWFVTMGRLYIFNEPNQIVAQPESTVQ